MKKIVLAAAILTVVMLTTGCEWFEDIGQPDIAKGDIDLDTTYFPFGLGYEWCYEYHKTGWTDESDEPIVYDEYDTITIVVSDSTWQNDTLVFQLSDGIYILGDRIRFKKNRIFVNHTLIDYINIDPEETTLDSIQSHDYSEEYWGFTVEYRGDTLYVHTLYRHYDIVTGSHWSSSSGSSLLSIRGIGVIHHSYYSDDGYFLCSPNPDHSIGKSNRLLWFYNGSDTVYKAED